MESPMRPLLLTLAMLAPAAVCAQAAPRATAPAISQAETLLFETDHLAGIKTPAVLVYQFSKVSNIEPGFRDKIQLDLAGGDGKTRATLHFLSGTHKQDIPALDSARGNPVLLGFLERDIAEMARLTGGSAAYFRKRIRMALADKAQVSSQSIAYQGKAVAAQTVRIQPYLRDPMHARFEPYVRKTYTFVVSKQVPGGVYQLSSSLANGGGAALAGGSVAGRAPSGTTPTPIAARGANANGKVAGSAPLPEIDETITLASVAYPER
jgi:hypothetical protein